MHRTQLPARVEIFEVGPRDGLQNEPAFIATAEKVQFINLLTDAGCRRMRSRGSSIPDGCHKWRTRGRCARP
jgi:hydroxymethylglutaryl-CoA lyase